MSRFESWLADSGIGVSVKQFPAGTRTAVDAANAIGCDVGQIVKSLVFVAAGRPVVALVSGANRLDESGLAATAGEPVTKADAEVVRAATGYSIGGVPPFGHATDVPVFMDQDQRYRSQNANVEQIGRQIARVEDRMGQRIKELVSNEREATDYLRKELEVARGQRYNIRGV
ncbi:MAG: YbaK/EbsC family protein [Chloroflexi bacterium]|nr:MAG: YbaK/EbsC family protein [Chloroflexota bacterium]